MVRGLEKVCGCKLRGSDVWRCCWRVGIGDGAVGLYVWWYDPLACGMTRLRIDQRDRAFLLPLGSADGCARSLCLGLWIGVGVLLPMVVVTKLLGWKSQVEHHVFLERMSGVLRYAFDGGAGDCLADQALHGCDALMHPGGTFGRSSHPHRGGGPCH